MNTRSLLPARRMAILCGHTQPVLERAEVSTAVVRPVGIDGGSGRRFHGLACVVTGGASGVGRAVAAILAKEGGCVLVVDIDGPAAEATAKELNDEVGSGRAAAFRADVTSEQDNQAIVAACLERFGSLNVYVANAGILPEWCELKDSTLSSFERTLRVNLVGPFLALKHASAAMRPGSAFVCTASIAAIRADVAPVEYSASKAALLGLVRASQDFLLEAGIRVNAVAPGGVNTPIVAKTFMSMQKRGLQVQGYDMSRFPLSEPEEIAEVVAFLASGAASSIMGQCIVADKALTNGTGMKVVEIPKKQKKTQK